jgi:imidazolonepropionase-like amidohydrolase
MRRILRIALKVLLAVLAMIIVMVIAVVVALWPPKPLAVPAQGVTLTGVTIVNPGGTRATDQTIVVKEGQIASIASSAQDAASAAGDASYKGYFVLPGLIDMHTHNPPPPANADLQYFFLMYLAHGVTTIRDTGNNGFMLQTRADVAQGKVVGPRIFTCGPILDGDPPVWPFSRVVRNAAEADRIVDDLASQHVDFVKVYERLTPEALAGIEAAAKRHSLPVVGHVPELVKFEDAHIDDVQHLTRVDLEPQSLIASPHEMIGRWAKGWEAVDDARIKFIVDTSLAQHIAHTPTIVVNDRISRLYDIAAQLRDPVASMVPAWYPQIVWQSPAEESPEDQKHLNDSARLLNQQVPKMKLVVRRLHEAGVTVHLGTDTLNPFVVPGEAMHEEMHNFLDAGYTPEQVWQAATAGNGASLPPAGLGTLRPGAPADFAVFRQDPTQNLDALSEIAAVVANGRLYTHDDLDAALLAYRKRFDSASYKFVAMTIMRATMRATGTRDTRRPEAAPTLQP